MNPTVKIPSESYLPPAEEAAVSIPFADVAPYTSLHSNGKWFKGNTHTHTWASDGRCFPEEAALLYKQLGWNFLFLTDHNTAHGDANAWLNSSKWCFNAETVKNFKDAFPSLAPEERTEDNGTQSYRLRTLGEIANLFNEPERFLILPGNEISVNSQNGDDLHCNLLNCNLNCRVKSLPDVPANLNYSLGLRDVLLGQVNPEAVFVVNHPLWKYFDVLPEYVIAHPSIRFFEISNTGAKPLFSVPEGAATCDKWWDVVNAARATAGQPLIYGVAGDDTHEYQDFYNGVANTPGKLSYTVINAPALKPAELIENLYRGNFYASRGVDFKAVSYAQATRTLAVEVQPLPGYEYTIQFIGTQRGTDCSCQKYIDKNVSDELPEWLKPRPFNRDRKVPVYSSRIGAVLKEVHALNASYTLQDDDLYARVKVIAKPPVQGLELYAWTQPVK